MKKNLPKLCPFYTSSLKLNNFRAVTRRKCNIWGKDNIFHQHGQKGTFKGLRLSQLCGNMSASAYDGSQKKHPKALLKPR